MAKNGVKIQNFEKSKKVPLDISEIHVVSKFGPIPMKIVAGSSNTHIHTMDFSIPWYTIIPTYFYTYTAYLPKTQLSCTNFTHLTPYCFVTKCFAQIRVSLRHLKAKPFDG